MTEAIYIVNVIFYSLLVLTVLLTIPRIVMICMGLKPQKPFKEAEKQHKFAILIPARNESKVIRQLLESIKAQDYDEDKIDTYVIVESLDDPTCQICEEYKNVFVFCREHLELKGKGYALDECFKYIKKKQKDATEKYEAYYIFDADNVLAKNYISEMNKVYDQGYKVAVGYRAIKNVNDSAVAACSGYYFTMFSTFKNKPKAMAGLDIQVCGTGFYVDANVIDELGGWPFHTITEDYEFSQYILNNNVKNTYNERAKFYDEQPAKFSVSFKQRIRWCKGFLQVGKVHKKEIREARAKATGKKIYSVYENYLTIFPLVLAIVTFAYFELANLVLLIINVATKNQLWISELRAMVIMLIALYLVLVLYTYITIIAENKRCHPTFWTAIKTGLFNPIFMIAYVPIFLTAFFSKTVEWVPIEHTATLDEAEMLEVQNDAEEELAYNKKEV